jgi:hypothetical protein
MEDKISALRVLFSSPLSLPDLEKRTLWKRSRCILGSRLPGIIWCARYPPFFPATTPGKRATGFQHSLRAAPMMLMVVRSNTTICGQG